MKTKITLFALILIVANKFYAQWTEINPGINENFQVIDCIDGTNCFIGGTLNTLMKTTDGVTWTNVDVMGLSGGIGDIKMFNKDTIYITKNGSLFKTTDGGANWAETPLTVNISIQICFVNKTIAYSVVSQDEIYKTTDGAVNWTWINTSPSEVAAINDIYFLNEQIGFMTAHNGGDKLFVFKTINGAQNWTKVYEKTITTIQSLKDLKMVSNTVGYAAGSNGMIVKTTDEGESWVALENPYKDSSMTFWAMDFINENSGYVVGTTTAILKTTDGGQTWIDESYTTAVLTDVAVTSLDTVYIGVGSLNNLILKNTNANLVANIYENNIEIGKIYPNPIQDYLNITINKPNTKIVIYNTLGKKIMESKLSVFNVNELNLGDIQSGTYIYEILLNQNPVYNGKLIKN